MALKKLSTCANHSTVNSIIESISELDTTISNVDDRTRSYLEDVQEKANKQRTIFSKDYFKWITERLSSSVFEGTSAHTGATSQIDESVRTRVFIDQDNPGRIKDEVSPDAAPSQFAPFTKCSSHCHRIPLWSRFSERRPSDRHAELCHWFFHFHSAECGHTQFQPIQTPHVQFDDRARKPPVFAARHACDGGRKPPRYLSCYAGGRHGGQGFHR